MNGNAVTTGLLGVIALILVGAVLKAASSILLPLIIAVFLSFIVVPLVNLLDRTRIPRVMAIGIVLMVLFGIMFLIFLFLQTSVNSFLREYPKYATRYTEISGQIEEMIKARFSINFDFRTDINWQGAIRGYLISLSGSLMQFFSALGLILIFLIFLLLEKPLFKNKLSRAFDEETGRHIGRVAEHINQQVGRYINLKFFISLGTGFVVWVLLTFIGMDFPIVWGVLAFLLNFIPSIGSLFFVVITIIMGVVQFYPLMGKIVAVTISMVATQVLIGNILDPRLQGQRLNISPLVILFSLIFWGWIWGVVGMFLAVPIMVVIKIVCENIPSLKPIAILMESGHVVSKQLEHTDEV
ncbi:MAG TPA: AI-2E family transporter [Sediminispirochaeta sp.]|nr:AI-2E family transporter [Sediminispirochaeta sp.]